MSPQRAFFRKEIMEYLSTWRIRVLLVPVLAMAIAGPLFMWYAPTFLGTRLGSYGNIDLIIQEPTWLDAFEQWTIILKQIVPLLLIVLAGSTITSERDSGAAAMVISGGLPRRDFMIIKFAVVSLMAVLAITAGTFLMWVVSRSIFPGMPFWWNLAIIGVASLLAFVLNAIAIMITTVMPDDISGVGLEILIILLLAATAFWQPARRYSPTGLLTSLSDIVKYNEVNVLMPAVSAVVTTIVTMAVAIRVFEARDL